MPADYFGIRVRIPPGPPLAADCSLWRDFAANHRIATRGADNRRFHVTVLYLLKIGNDCNRPIADVGDGASNTEEPTLTVFIAALPVFLRD